MSIERLGPPLVASAHSGPGIVAVAMDVLWPLPVTPCVSRRADTSNFFNP